MRPRPTAGVPVTVSLGRDVTGTANPGRRWLASPANLSWAVLPSPRCGSKPLGSVLLPLPFIPLIPFIPSIPAAQGTNPAVAVPPYRKTGRPERDV
jgi:hypothetical protein